MPSINFCLLEIQFLEILALILIACLTVLVFKRIGLGAILGYLAVGVIVGASLTLGFTKDPDKLLHFAEFGVVLFLFVIGLEMKPSRLWEMRGDIFGIGLPQASHCRRRMNSALCCSRLPCPQACWTPRHLPSLSPSSP